MTLFLEQMLNGLQLGVMLFLMAAGLTLIFGIMGIINLAHGSIYMVGAYAGTLVIGQTGSFLLGIAGALGAAAVTGVVMEMVVIRRLYRRDHLDQVLATFAIILILNRGAFFASLIIGVVDTMLRAYLPGLLRQIMVGSEADALGAGISSMGIYLLMALVLLVRPKGLFAADS
jgi:branched-subunit amino acid ABC-type transport system permease component